jgi:hypothetical protein
MRWPAFAWVGVVFCLSFAAALGAGCGSSRGSGFDDNPIPAPERGEFDGLETIDVTPKQADLVAGDTNQAQAFTATGRYKDGTTKDLTSAAIWTVSKDNLIAMSGATATPTGTRGGIATLTAAAGGKSGEAEVRVKWVKTFLQPGAAPGSEARFKGTTDDPKLAPTVAYPLAGSLLPPNIPPIEVQWKPAVGTDLFDIAFVGTTLDLHLITPCNAIGTTGGCGLVIEQGLFSNIMATLAGDDPSDVIVRGAGATAGVTGASAKIATQVAKDDIKGGLYYFTTRAAAGEKPGIYRYDFTTKKVGAFFTDGSCAGCHALSKDGTKMLAPVCTLERGCGRPMQLAVVDVATKQVVSPAMPIGDSDTQTWSPDNRFYVTTPQCQAINPNAPGDCAGFAGGVMSLIDAKTNTLLGKVPAGAGALYPSFSNDGKKLVYARGASYRGPLSIQRSSLYALDFDATKSPPTWSAEKALYTAGATDYENNYHPSYSPDDKWILFTRSHCNAGDDPNSVDINGNTCDSYNDYTARTWIVPAGGGNPIECTRANGEGRNIVSWPKWSPFKSTYKGGDIFWYTVSSTRDYGFRALHNHAANGNPTDGVQQLWLVGFDPKKAAAGQDPSFAIVWLPFQDVASSNHIGQWTEAIVGEIVK